jgi:integrase
VLRDELLAAGLSARTVVRQLTVAHGVFRFAMRHHGLERNPASAELVDRPTVRYTGEFHTLDSDELAALARAAADEQDATLYLTAAMTGLRQGELLALRWRDLDFAGQRVHVRRAWSQAAKTEKAPKSGKVRSVPLVAELISPLDRLSRRQHFTGDDDLVFCSEVGAHLDAWALRRRYEAALARAGLPRVRFHDLRPGPVSRQLASACSIGCDSVSTTVSRASTTAGSNCCPLQRRSSARADAGGIAGR